MPRGSSPKRERQYEHIEQSEGAGGPTYRQLYAEAQRRGLKGRSTMDKAQLERALAKR